MPTAVDTAAAPPAIHVPQDRARGPNGGPTPRQRIRKNVHDRISDRAKVTTAPNTKPGMPAPSASRLRLNSPETASGDYGCRYAAIYLHFWAPTRQMSQEASFGQSHSSPSRPWVRSRPPGRGSAVFGIRPARPAAYGNIFITMTR